MKLQEIFSTYNEFIIPSYTKTPLVFIKGKGSYVWDVAGKKYLDFFPGWGAGNLGHCHTKVMTAVRDQVSKLIFIPNNYYNPCQAALAKELNFWAGNQFKLFFCNSGAEANEAAIKLARKSGNGKFEIITFENAFHGRTFGALSATGQEKYQQGFLPMCPGFRAVSFNDINAVKKAVTDKTTGIMLELVQGEGGITIASQEFVKGLRAFCDENKLLLIIDEVQTGIGRTGKMFAWQHYGITPDIFTLAKSLGGGLPIGVMMAKKGIADLLSPGTHGSTFGGGPVVCKAALAVLRSIHKEKLIQNAVKMGDVLVRGLNNLKAKHSVIKDVRGIGLMCGLELTKPGKAVVEEAYKCGLLINCTHDTVLRIMPALIVTEKQIRQALEILDDVLTRVKL
jgi:acetylornithine/N-succinyldiaminopimelate aminotransferase